MRALGSLVVALLLLPVAGASWRAAGSLEPDYAPDAEGGLMYAEPDVGAGPPQVYFNAYVAIEQLALNPNVALLGTALATPGAVHHRAMLGLWRDCNRDGYVGLAESAIQDYAAALLPADSPCPVGSIFNDGAWVSEMIGIGMVDPCELESAEVRRGECGNIAEFHLNPRVLYANGTMVWGDVGAPGEVPRAECVSAPLPRGATTGTGAMLGALDCQTDRAVAGSVNAADADGRLGLRFEDPEHPESSSSLLNQPFPATPFGGPQGPGVLEAESGSRSATVWDCASPKGSADVRSPTPLPDALVADPSGGQLSGRQTTIVGTFVVFADEDGDAGTPGVLRVPLQDRDGSALWAPALAPSVDDPTASSWDAAEAAADGPRGDCDGETAARGAHPKPLVESETGQIDEAKRDRSSLTFTFYDGHRGLNDRVDPFVGDTTPSDAGLLYRRNDHGGDGPLWNADQISEQDPQLVSRRGLHPEGARYVTYYARLGAAVSAAGYATPGATGVYGGESCGTGIADQNGWVCDPARWWRDAAGHDVRPRYRQGAPYAPLRGDEYQLRDVDCYDGSLARGSGVYASLALLDAPC